MHHLEIEARERFLQALDDDFGDEHCVGASEIFDDAISEAIQLNAELPKTAPGYLNQAAEEMADRAKSRDAENGERSMGRAVAAFNWLYGHQLTETEGWQFMSLLKKARGAQGAYREDDYVDDIAYCALAAESAAR